MSRDGQKFSCTLPTEVLKKMTAC